MPTNANTFNSRVTSEALEKKFRDVFPAQGGAELVQDLFASGVIQPVIDFSSVAEGSVLGTNLQTAWDFSTGHSTANNNTQTLITNTGFWQVDLNWSGLFGSGNRSGSLFLDSGVTTKIIWEINTPNTGTSQAAGGVGNDSMVVYLRAGDSLKAVTNNADTYLDVWYRQIADVSGNLVNPFGFVSS